MWSIYLSPILNIWTLQEHIIVNKVFINTSKLAVILKLEFKILQDSLSWRPGCTYPHIKMQEDSIRISRWAISQRSLQSPASTTVTTCFMVQEYAVSEFSRENACLRKNGPTWWSTLASTRTCSGVYAPRSRRFTPKAVVHHADIDFTHIWGHM